ncbi:hexaprenyldihydroxybenzoate methyltransferase [Coprinopsis marcescibilis]|uniref:Hexaprenyldihydroxybenzoate methyltransferase n=1 Tax=Coprinopsis marcescibilis TaxID=230819 RepID=A0A5C3KWA1_COPMA|nr:hexaprenyldihydroxybenzoate methyltransferase [Coprinopsis marcescibilis]
MSSTNQSFISSNREHFNELASNYRPSKSSLELAKRAARAILKRHAFDGETTEAMDFACGAGLLSQQFAPHVKSMVGVDISQGMVDIFNAVVSNQGISPEEMRAVCMDIQDEGDKLGGQLFDVIVCSMAYHHFESIEHITRTLSTHLKPSGALVVVDLLKSEDVDVDSLFPEHQDQIVAHRGGISEKDIELAFESSGLSKFELHPDISVKKNGHDLRIFVAKGVKHT